MRKEYTKTIQARLLHELMLLRKGSGLTPAKLYDTPTLQTITSRITNTPVPNLTNHQIYNILITEIAHLPQDIYMDAASNALGIHPSNTSLLKRRAHLAKKLGKHTDTIERYENRGFASLASRLIERGHTNKATLSPRTTSSHHLQKLERYTKTTQTIAELSLGSHLSLNTPDATDLLSYLQQTQRPYLDAQVSIKLTASHRGNEWYKFFLTRTFRGIRETFRIAVVLSNADGERLMASGLIDDFHKLTHPDDFRQDIKTITTNSKILLKNPGNNTQKLLRFQELDADAAQRILQSAETHFVQPCRLLEVAIPLEWQIADVIYEHRSVLHLKTDEHYAYWYSPGLMHLRKLTFDFSNFPNADQRRFFIQPFLGLSSGEFHQDKRFFILNQNTWLMPGHGITLIWQ